jgi:hypothetical protein
MAFSRARLLLVFIALPVFAQDLGNNAAAESLRLRLNSSSLLPLPGTDAVQRLSPQVKLPTTAKRCAAVRIANVSPLSEAARSMPAFKPLIVPREEGTAVPAPSCADPITR